MALKDELINLLIVPVGSSQPIEIPDELSEVISKYITNHIVQNKIIGAVDVTGAKYVIFSDEFYYEFVPKAIAFIINVFLHLSHFMDLLILALESASLTLQK